MAQVTQVQGKNIPFSRVAIARPEKGQPVKLVVQVPVNVSLRTAMRIQNADTDPGFTAPFATCTRNGCFAEFDLKDGTLKKPHAATGVGKLSFADSGGHDVTIPISFRGFSQAFDALAKKYIRLAAERCGYEPPNSRSPALRNFSGLTASPLTRVS